MNLPAFLFIGLRYTRAKRRNHYVSFISLTSMIGIALGIAVLITVLSVMNGFDKQIRQQIFAYAQQITLTTDNGKIVRWPELMQALKNQPQVLGIAPLVNQQTLLTAQGNVQATYLLGVDPKSYQQVSTVPTQAEAQFTKLQPGQFHITLGQGLADQLNVSVGDKVTVVAPEATVSVVGMLPRFKVFTVTGIFSAGTNSEVDRALAYIHLNDAQALFHLSHMVSTLQLKLQDLYQAPKLAQALRDQLSPNFIIHDWTFDYGTLFDAIRLEKKMMFIILSFIIAVAAFNLVSSLVMIVNDKKADIAILRTLGARKSTIMRIFMVQGFTVGLVGILAGIGLGIILALNVTSLANGLEELLGIKFLSSSIYYVDYLPSELQWSDIISVTIAAVVMCLSATLYPAWRAAKQEPVEALRYE
jgi:lipoprotein-releasing system permease protein